MIASQLRRWQARLFFGWWVLVAVVVLQVVVVGLFFQTFGVYVPFLIEEFGWSATAISLAVSARQLLGVFTGPGIGFALDRFGSRRIIAIGLCLMGVSYIIFSTVHNFLFFVIIQLFLGLAANLSGWLPSTKIIVNWFVKRRTMALALMGTGMALGGLLTPIVAYFMALYGWRPIAIASGLLTFLGLLLLPLLKSSPEAYGLRPEGSQTSQAAVYVSAGDFTAQEAMRTRSFWLLAFGHSFALVGVVSVIVHYVTHLSNGLGYSLQSAASLFALITVMQIVGQLMSGFFGDAVSKRGLATGAMLFDALAIFLLATSESMPLIVVASVLHGLAWGTRGPLMSALRADYFGRSHFGKIMGISDPIVIAGALVGPIIAGYSFDASGSYQQGFIWISISALLGAACFALSVQPKKPFSLDTLDANV